MNSSEVMPPSLLRHAMLWILLVAHPAEAFFNTQVAQTQYGQRHNATISEPNPDAGTDPDGHIKKMLHKEIEKDLGVTLPWWLRVNRHRIRPHRSNVRLADEVAKFVASAHLFMWTIFILVWMILLSLSFVMEGLRLRRWWEHLCATSVWICAALVCLGAIWLSMGSKSAEMWCTGYAMELILSMENIFLYEMILVAFKVPASLARYALFVTSLCQMLFQMFLFMGIAEWLRSIRNLHYMLGFWLVFLAFQTLRDDEHQEFDPEQSGSYKAFSFALGNRLLPSYSSRGGIFVRRGSKMYVTMLGPVICCLLTIMFAMEVDVTLTKIEEIDNHFLAWTSSVLAAFALPELFEVVRELLRTFYLLKVGISLLLLFFGASLLLRSWIELSDEVEIGVMISIVALSILMSKLLGYDSRDSNMYLENVDKKDCPQKSYGAADHAPVCMSEASFEDSADISYVRAASHSTESMSEVRC
eukprot:TRINITY_DN2524_c0_g1_i2.p1 TRINITY_DN2524_c0_g1~~TRINITY_DN2524_c0_g1_i2.p1  ORF type:complete len:472 (-),score=74.18 TRINITY_DN2524_c0_g1_i2:99-1514(-)